MKRILFPLLAALALATATLAIAQSSDPYQSGTSNSSPTSPSATSTTPAPATTPTTSASGTNSEPATTQGNAATMPKTASPLPILGVSALLALAAGYSLMRPRRRA
jgi:hypothetical protein